MNVKMLQGLELDFTAAMCRFAIACQGVVLASDNLKFALAAAIDGEDMATAGAEFEVTAAGSEAIAEGDVPPSDHHGEWEAVGEIDGTKVSFSGSHGDVVAWAEINMPGEFSIRPVPVLTEGVIATRTISG